MDKRKLILGITLGMVLIMIALCSYVVPDQTGGIPRGWKVMKPVASADSIINITSNAGFSAYASSGNGSSSNPWMIRNKIINANNSNSGIHIANTNEYFVLENCTVFNGTRGIHLDNVDNGVVRNCTLYGNAQDGILIASSTYNTVTNNTLFNNTLDSIQISSSTHNLVENNTCFGQQIRGILLIIGGDYNNIINNTVFNATGHGIELLGANYCNVSRNHAWNNSNAGIRVAGLYNLVSGNWLHNNSYGLTVNNDAMGNVVTGNHCFNNSQIGLDISLVYNNWTLSYNRCYNNRWGILVSVSTGLTLVHNVVYDNTQLGIQLSNTNSSYVYNNTITTNEAIGLYLGSGSTGNLLLGNSISLVSTSKKALSIVSSGGNRVFGNTINTGGIGIGLESSQSTIVNGNYVDAGYIGINIDSSSMSNITGNTVPMCNYAIWLYKSTHCLVLGNILDWDTDAICLSIASNNSILNNTMTRCGLNGINFFGVSHWNNVTGNIVNGSDQYAVSMDDSDNNNITGNTFLNIKYMPCVYIEVGTGNIISPNECTHKGPVVNTISPAFDTDGMFRVQWGAITGATIYHVFISETPITSVNGLTPISSSVAIFHDFTIIENGPYYFCVIGGSTHANTTMSNIVSVTVGIPLPYFPINLTANPTTSSNGIVTLDWDDIPGATHYHVYRSSDVMWTVSGLSPVGMATSSNYVDTVQQNGKYYYVVIASDGFVDSGPSNNVIVTVTLPPAVDGAMPVVVLGAGAAGVVALIFVLSKKRAITVRK